MSTSSQRTAKACAALLIALGATAGAAACGHPAPAEPDTAPASAAPPPATPAAAMPSPAAPPGYDIDGIDNVKNDFPDGFTTDAHPSKTLDQGDLDSSGIAAFTGVQVDPPQCRALIIPPYAEPSVGTVAAGVRGQGDHGSVYVVALRQPQAIPPGTPPADCDQITLSGAPQASGTAEAVPAPDIAGVTTTGAVLDISGEDDPDYLFTAALDDHTTVVVMGSVDDSLNPTQFMSDLLVKSVAAVRGR